MNSRLQSLIDRGYDENDVISISYFSKEDLDVLSDIALSKAALGCLNETHPVALFIGGQPGCGKTTFSFNLKNKYNNLVEIGIDNYRMYHPNYLVMEECIKKHWENRIPNENDTPGNDIADFTHEFSGQMTDEIIRKAVEKRYNLAIEWSMREPTEPLKTMIDMKQKGYDISTMFLAVDKETSMEACNIRNEVMNSHDRITRRIPTSFHELCINTLPDAVDYLYENGYKKGIIDKFNIISRNFNKLWDENSRKNPGQVYLETLNNQMNDSNNFNNKFYSEIAYQKEIEGLDLVLKEKVTNNNKKM